MSGLDGTVLVTWSGFDPADDATAGVLRAAGLDVRFAPRLQERSEEELVGLAHDAVAVIADADPFTADVIRQLPRLRVIARVGVGLDSVDLVAARAAGIDVTTTPGHMEGTVADHTLALMLAVVRRIVVFDRIVRGGEWIRVERAGDDLHGRTVGVVGLGAIGRVVCRRLSGFDVHLLGHDPVAGDLPHVERVTFEELIDRSEIIVLNVPLTPATRGLISRDVIARMRPGAVLVNAARGHVVDEAALIAGLRSGHLGGAGLDVFAEEPAESSPLWTMDNVVLSPHIGGVSRRSIRDMTERAVQCTIASLHGEPTGVVNP
ncbi:phosphoglycerate dehydrogenase [Capillimicrobium parvum]|uniref:Hydroxypyruvate reductase n=1 Tax=Capillimicrobium parvum TaxID=2884022 RepID=A0A9E6XT64_9ACTN|nr:phosphoglycerate dehydrogenase [Capillimicrobium parvum]UGS33683.1 Hydroxypyruvate reductase [Capillimicrobium parvum]